MCGKMYYINHKDINNFILTKYDCFYHPVYPGEYELSNNVISESGSSATGRVCYAPLTSVLFDGIPTLTGLEGDMWASQLLTFNTSVSSASITFNFTVTRDNNGITTYTGLETIEVVMFNCPMRGIATTNIAILAGGSLIDTILLNENSTSCDYLVRVCLDATLATTSPIITLNFNSLFQRLYVAEITFYSSMNRQCSPDGPITTSVITTTASGNFNCFFCIMYFGCLVVSQQFSTCGVAASRLYLVALLTNENTSSRNFESWRAMLLAMMSYV